MRKIIIILFCVLLVGALGGVVFYRYYLPDIVAEAVIAKDELPGYLPNPVKNRIEGIREPVNAGAEDIVREMHESNVPLEKILRMIDNTTEEMGNDMLDELSKTPIANTDQAFDIIKKHLKADFDLEVLRKPFNENVDMQTIRKGIQYGNINRKSHDIEMETARAIAKKVLIEKEKQIAN